MSLFDGIAPLDHLLETVVKSETFIALRKDSGSTRGRGTAEDPYDGSYVGGECRLDTVLRSLPEHTTICLGPGEFSTLGFKDSSTQGFAPKKGWRIVGAGWAQDTVIPNPPNPDIVYKGPTVLKLIGHTSGQKNVAVGCGYDADEECDGFELAHLAIDCGFSGAFASGTTAAGIDVNGANIRIHDVRVANFGAGPSTDCDVVTIARPSPSQPDARNCLLYDSVIESPGAVDGTGRITCIKLKATPNGSTFFYHLSCVVRNVLVDCGADGLNEWFEGISAHGGRGTIVEQNRFWNCLYGFHVAPEYGMSLQHPTMDLIVRDNYFFNVRWGFEFLLDTDNNDQWVGRLILQDNMIDLITSDSATGVKLDGESEWPGRFHQFLARKNQIRHLNGDPGNVNAYGMDFDSVAAGIVEENLISIGPTPANPDIAKAIKRSAYAAIKTFNNQSAAGVFLPSTYGTPTRQDPDLVKDAQDWMIGA